MSLSAGQDHGVRGISKSKTASKPVSVVPRQSGRQPQPSAKLREAQESQGIADKEALPETSEHTARAGCSGKSAVTSDSVSKIHKGTGGARKPARATLTSQSGPVCGSVQKSSDSQEDGEVQSSKNVEETDQMQDMLPILSKRKLFGALFMQRIQPDSPVRVAEYGITKSLAVFARTIKEKVKLLKPTAESINKQCNHMANIITVMYADTSIGCDLCKMLSEEDGFYGSEERKAIFGSVNDCDGVFHTPLNMWIAGFAALASYYMEEVSFNFVLLR
jgi:hypothetical protein